MRYTNSPSLSSNNPRQTSNLRASISPTSASIASPGDGDLLNLVLNVAYLQAQFYSVASSGARVAPSLLNGNGSAGTTTGGRAVAFADRVVSGLAAELAATHVAQVEALRRILGASAVAQRQINLGSEPDGAFAQLGRLGGGITSPGQGNDPYGDDDGFLLAAYYLVGAATAATSLLLTQAEGASTRDLASGLLATSSHHVSAARLLLHERAPTSPRIAAESERLTAVQTFLARNFSFDGLQPQTEVLPAGQNAGRPVAVASVLPATPQATADATSSNLLNLLFLAPGAVGGGGFYPSGVNGAISTGTRA